MKKDFGFWYIAFMHSTKREFRSKTMPVFLTGSFGRTVLPRKLKGSVISEFVWTRITISLFCAGNKVAFCFGEMKDLSTQRLHVFRFVYTPVACLSCHSKRLPFSVFRVQPPTTCNTHTGSIRRESIRIHKERISQAEKLICMNGRRWKKELFPTSH